MSNNFFLGHYFRINDDMKVNAGRVGQCVIGPHNYGCIVLRFADRSHIEIHASAVTLVDPPEAPEVSTAMKKLRCVLADLDGIRSEAGYINRDHAAAVQAARYPPIKLRDHPLYEDAEHHPQKTCAYRPRYILLTPLVDNAGSGREDGWAMRWDLSDGSRAYIQIARRKIWQGQRAIRLGTCDGLHAWLTVERDHGALTEDEVRALAGQG